jgi:hypothetical protein
MAWSLPVNSSQSLTRFSSTCATVTWGGGGAWGPPGLPQLAAINDEQATIERVCNLLIFIILESLYHQAGAARWILGVSHFITSLRHKT